MTRILWSWSAVPPNHLAERAAFEALLDQADWLVAESLRLMSQANELYALVCRWRPGLAERHAAEHPRQIPDSALQPLEWPVDYE